VFQKLAFDIFFREGFHGLALGVWHWLLSGVGQLV
jgi:hypothetical protein